MKAIDDKVHAELLNFLADPTLNVPYGWSPARVHNLLQAVAAAQAAPAPVPSSEPAIDEAR